MTAVPRQRAIIDRRVVTARLDEVASWSGYSPKTRGEILGIFKQALADGYAEVRRRFEDTGTRGAEVVRANAFLIDQMVRLIHDFAVTYVYPRANLTTGEQLSIVATGGYGRGELAPYSDIDLMFLLPYKKTAHTEQIVEFILYMLWDLGLKVGHATRSIDEAVRLSGEDLTISTSLLESRWLWGDQDLFIAFQERFRRDVVAGTEARFVTGKLAERDQRHERMGDTRYVLEPNIKEGKGGLRDLQTLFWLARYIYGVGDMAELVDRGVLTRTDTRRFAKAYNFLWTVRCHLHYRAGRAEERLAFDVQHEIARRMGYADRSGAQGVERFMKHYFLIAKSVGDLTRLLCAILEEDQKKSRLGFNLKSLPFFRRSVLPGLTVLGGRIDFDNNGDPATDPMLMLHLFHQAQVEKLDIHPRALRRVSQNLKHINRTLRASPEANEIFMAMLTGRNDPKRILTMLNEAGVLGRLVPDFGRVVAQMQYDMYHVYTVDEHTIRAIGILHRIEAGELADDHPASTKVIGALQSRAALYVALFLHDIAKGRGGDHAVLGAGVADKLAPRFGLNDWERETVSWLVRHHLSMSRTAFKRDLDDPKTVTDFAALVQSPERLRMLLVLTVCDIRAVGPDVWNDWKATLLRQLFYRTLEVVSGSAVAERRGARAARARSTARDGLADCKAEDVERYLNYGYPDYWLAYNTATHIRHAKMIFEAERRELSLHTEFIDDPARGVTDVIIYTPDHPGLFANIAGAMALSGASVVDAKIATLSNGMALDTFSIQGPDGGPFHGRLERLTERVANCLSGQLNPALELEKARARALPSRMGVFSVPPRVLIDNEASTSHTVIEVNGRDRLGLLYELTAAITDLGLHIASAHISTYGERVVDVFYVKDIFGLKADSDEKCRMIEKKILATLSPGKDNGPKQTETLKTPGAIGK